MGIRIGKLQMRNYRLGPGMILIWILGALGMGVAA